MTIYAFVYSSNTWESAAATMSLHKTKEGAEKAMESHREFMRKHYNEYFSEKHKKQYPFGLDQSWGIEEIEVKD